MTRKWRHWALCIVLAIGSVLAAWSLDEVSFFQTLNLKAYDAHFVLRNYLFGPPPIPNIALLTDDQKAMDNFSELYDFWNDHYAAAITAAGEAGAKVIGLDRAFGIPIDDYVKGADERLAGQQEGPDDPHQHGRRGLRIGGLGQLDFRFGRLLPQAGTHGSAVAETG